MEPATTSVQSTGAGRGGGARGSRDDGSASGPQPHSHHLCAEHWDGGAGGARDDGSASGPHVRTEPVSPLSANSSSDQRACRAPQAQLNSTD